ncbi:MAG: FG-GAP-like repeat-containing protein, partial [Gemmatimonadetes bacterium]|nr:FG-GAP-like repeat-containing protein [Gemmatimonadota bacterium]
SEWTWGAMFIDVDLDGVQDLLVTNGHAWDPLDGDTQDDLRSGRAQVDWREELGIFPELKLRNLAFRNLGDGTFEETGAAWGYGVEPDISHGIAAADLDRDGDRDVVITRLNEPPRVFENVARANRLAIRLVDGARNTSAIGARLTLEGGAHPLQTRQVTAGGMYLSGSDPAVTFAMGDAERAVLTVTWPSGERRSLSVETNRAYEIGPEAGVPDAVETGASVPPLFEAGRVVSRHVESEFDELGRQPLIPLELSRLGPGVTWEDVDGDGDPDVITTSAAGGQAQLARTEAGSFLDPIAVGPPAPGDQTTVLLIPGVAGPSLLAGVSSWEARTPAEVAEIPPLMALSSSGATPIPAVAATGPLAAADIDVDGDLDLFLGARAIPGAYPRPASSRILLNENGSWVVDTSRSAAFNLTGLVSGAVFSDLDGDGDADLVLAVEWGPLRLFLNQGARFQEVTEAWGLAAWPGRWNGVATGDLDGDGRPDLVATSWGANTGLAPTTDRPAGIHAADFDGNGLVEVIETETDASGLETARRDYLTLIQHLPMLRRSVSTFEDFGRAGLDQLLPTGRDGVYSARAVTLEHTAFLNRDGSFEAIRIAGPAQRAPAFGVVVADFDLDGHEDLFLAQNFLATPEGLPRHDAGRGAVLLGRGDGTFETLDASRSGIAVYGDARGAAVADYDADGRWDLAVAQNGGETLVFRGAGERRGLRIRLVGPPANPTAVGASVRLAFSEGEGPAREVQAGSGYWSKNGATQVFGRAAEARAAIVRWPGGVEERFPIPDGALDLVLRPGAGER